MKGKFTLFSKSGAPSFRFFPFFPFLPFLPTLPFPSFPTMSVFEKILSLVGNPVPFRYTPVVRDSFAPTTEDVARIQFYSTTPMGPRGKVWSAWNAEWAEKIRGSSPTCIRAMETRGILLRLNRPVEGSVEWRHIVFGYTTEEYDEMDRVGLSQWEESFRMNEEKALAFREAFLSLSSAETVTCARLYKNAAAWGVLESFLSEEDREAIHSEVAYLDRLEDAMDRREHEWDD